MGHVGPKMVQLGYKMGHVGLNLPSRRPKKAPRGPQEAPERLQDCQTCRKTLGFSMIFASPLRGSKMA